jgi:hypothetical protein
MSFILVVINDSVDNVPKSPGSLVDTRKLTRQRFKTELELLRASQRYNAYN